MPWVRYDDRYRLHRKIRPLTDRLFRLATEAIMWSASEENLTDGRIERADLVDIRPKATPTDATALVTRDIWHRAGDPCNSPTCPPPNPGTGWRIHDYFDYQPSREKVITDRAAKAERQRNWMARRRGTDTSAGVSTGPPRDTPADVSHGASAGAAPYPAPPRPAPKGRAGTLSPQQPPAATGGEAPAGGWEEDPNPGVAHGRKGTPSPPPDLTDLRKHLAAASSRHRASSHRPGAFDELRDATPDLPALVEAPPPPPEEQPE